MMENVTFENTSGAFYIPQTYGILLKSFSASTPKPKVFRESIDGRDGDLDFTEYAGEVRYENRLVNVAFRDTSGREYRQMVNFLNGQNVKVIYSANPEFYYSGRCEEINVTEKRHIVDVNCKIVCKPYMLANTKTLVRATVTDTAQLRLKAKRMSVIPQITVSAPMTLTWGEETISATGTATYPGIVITSTPQTLGVSGSGTITVAWRDGVM